MKRIRFFWWLIAGPIAVLAAVLLFAHPYLAITKPSGGNVMVVEGWIGPSALQQALDLYRTKGYERMYTTGSVRDFTYYLKPDESVEVTFEHALGGEVHVNASGVSYTSFAMIGDGDTLWVQPVAGKNTAYSKKIEKPVNTLRLVAIAPAGAARDTEVLFIRQATIVDKNIHLVQNSITLIHADSTRTPGWPTWADRAAEDLRELGLPADEITVVPTYGEPDSRSWASAGTFGVRAVKDELKSFDVVTLGVHARRSRGLFQQGVPENVVVGVISIPDPLCPANGWWRSVVGWYRMLKEIGGSPEAYAVELTR